jgi:hypothetical protein
MDDLYDINFRSNDIFYKIRIYYNSIDCLSWTISIALAIKLGKFY